MMTFESPANSGLLIARRMFEPDVATEFQQELEGLLEGQEKVDYNDGVSGCQLSRRIDEFLDEPGRYPVACSVLGRFGCTDITNTWVTLNFYVSGGKQIFHRDYEDIIDYPFIIHGAGEGAFDYSPTAIDKLTAEMDPNTQTVSLSAGDVMIQGRKNQFHRGRNTSKFNRITAALATYRPLD